MGGQDDFTQAKDFVSDYSVTTPTMLWDPSFQIWREYRITSTHAMILLNASLTEGSRSQTGFNADWILNNLQQFS